MSNFNKTLIKISFKKMIKKSNILQIDIQNFQYYLYNVKTRESGYI